MATINEDELNLEIRKFLKQVGITSQREIEKAVAAAIDAGALTGSEELATSMTLEVPALSLCHRIEGKIRLQ